MRWYFGGKGLYELGVVVVEVLDGEVEGDELSFVAVDFAKMEIDEAF